jgi:hypothetical protein
MAWNDHDLSAKAVAPKRVGPAGDGPEGGYSRAGLLFADE